MANEKLSRLTNISLNNIGKKYRDQWIFRNVDLEIKASEKIAITGSNGSGKSTLLQLLTGYITPTEGKMQWNCESGLVSPDIFYNYFSFCSPYLELIDDFTLWENVNFFETQKKFAEGLTTKQLVEKMNLPGAENKLLKYFSSGMKQRVKLALACFADSQVVFLDEPLSNLDASGFEWYKNIMDHIAGHRTIVICSNQVKEEIYCCSRVINIESYRKEKNVS